MSLDLQVEQCAVEFDRGWGRLRAEGYCEGVLLSGLIIACQRRLAEMAIHGQVEPVGFVNGTMERMKLGALDLVERARGRQGGSLEGGVGGV